MRKLALEPTQPGLQPVVDRLAPNRKTGMIRSVIASSSGNLVEWFDFYAYAFAQIYFARSFIPSDDPTLQLIYTSGIFAVGFLMRPVGGWVFGRIGDIYGRKHAMTYSVLLMCVGSLVIAVLPTYAMIGIAAPILLLGARLLQGLSLGGEFGTSATYMTEIASSGRRGFIGSFQYATLIGGQLLASLVVLILTATMSDQNLRAWGWRIPFFIGAVAAVVVFYLRRDLDETSTAESRAKEGAGSVMNLWRNHRRGLIGIIGYTAGGTLFFYTFTTYMQKYLINSAGIDVRSTGMIMTAALFILMCVQPLFGLFADRMGTKFCLVLFGILATLIVYPILTLIRGSGGNVWMAFGLVMVPLLVMSIYTSIGGLIKAELFPTEVRVMGVGFPYAVMTALFGGTAEYLALTLKHAGMETLYFWYVTAMCVVFLFVAIAMPKASTYGYLK